MRLYGRVSTRTADKVLEGRALIGLILVGLLIIMIAVESIFGKTGMSVLFTVGQFLFYFIALWVLIKFCKIGFNIIKQMLKNI